MTNQPDMRDQPSHEIDVAAYVSDGNRWLPFMICSCGYEATGYDWEDTGRGMDAHLKGVVLLIETNGAS